MNSRVIKKMLCTSAPPATIFIRIMVGGVFLSEGMQKFLFPDTLGAGRFISIGIPAPAITAVLVALFEMICGMD